VNTVSLTGSHVAVLGGSAGIGLATAQLLLQRGARVTIGGRNHDRLEAALGELGESASAIPVDAEDLESLRSFFAATGAIDGLVVTVTGRGGTGSVTDLARTDPLGAFARKTAPHLRAIALALPALAADASVTLVTAGSAQSALPGTVLLAAVNGALEAAIAPLAIELAPRRVNAVSPGVIETSWWDELPEPARTETLARFAERAPLRRNGSAQDVAQAIVGLIENQFITGVVLPCDGGLRLT